MGGCRQTFVPPRRNCNDDEEWGVPLHDDQRLSSPPARLYRAIGLRASRSSFGSTRRVQSDSENACFVTDSHPYHRSRDRRSAANGQTRIGDPAPPGMARLARRLGRLLGAVPLPRPCRCSGMPGVVADRPAECCFPVGGVVGRRTSRTREQEKLPGWSQCVGRFEDVRGGLVGGCRREADARMEPGPPDGTRFLELLRRYDSAQPIASPVRLSAAYW